MAKFLSYAGLQTIATKLKAMFVRSNAATTLTSGFTMSGSGLSIATADTKGLFYFAYTCTATSSTSKSGYINMNLYQGTPALEMQAVNRSTGNTVKIRLVPYEGRQIYITGGDSTKVLMGDGTPKAVSDLMSDYETRMTNVEDALKGAGLL